MWNGCCTKNKTQKSNIKTQMKTNKSNHKTEEKTKHSQSMRGERKEKWKMAVAQNPKYKNQNTEQKKNILNP